MKKFYLLLLLFVITPLMSDLDAMDDLQTRKITRDRLVHFPVPSDNSNYFFLQVIENQTAVVIGDFSGVQKMIVLIIDKNNDNVVDMVYEYYPLTKDMRKRTDSDSKFFTTDLAKLKKDIIAGTVYRNNFIDDMKSLDSLNNILKAGDSKSISSDIYGFSVRLFELEDRNNYSAMFVYGKNSRGYYLQFRTNFARKSSNTVQKPILNYSVFCKDTNDSVIKETVDELFKIRQPLASLDK